MSDQQPPRYHSDSGKAMTTPPSWCEPPEAHWPWRQRLPELHFVSTRFHPDGFDQSDFTHHHIIPPPSLHRAVAKRQAEYLAGRVCAREALRRSHGIPVVPASSSTGAPLWPSGGVGSITHSDGFAAAIAGPDSHYLSLGVDLEHRVTGVESNNLCHLILTAGERERFRQQLALDAGHLLTQVFSLKESLYKALFPLTQQRFYFHHAEVLSLDSRGLTRLRLLTDLSADWRSGQELDGHVTTDGERVLSLIAVPAKAPGFS